MDKRARLAQIGHMSESKAMMAFAQDLLSEMGAVDVKRFFGGAGIYAGPVMFGLIAGGTIYLKTDEPLRRDMAAEGAVPWLYAPRRGADAGVPQETHYLSLPPAAEDDPEEACAWGRRALAVAEAARAAKPKRSRG